MRLELSNNSAGSILEVKELKGMGTTIDVILYDGKVKKSDFRDLLKHSEKVAEKLWSNKADDIWDSV